jgi:hypothetical protein
MKYQRRLRRQPCGTVYHRQLRFELLENRRLLSITVNTLIDENDGIGVGSVSLRDAIAAAAPGETIDFSVTGTIPLTNRGQLIINKSLTISGPGADLLTVQAFDPTPTQKNGDGSRVFNIDDGNNANVLNVSISGLSLIGGDESLNGGAIHSLENLFVTDSAISGNSANGRGGGIFKSSLGSLSVATSLISGNSARKSGGGISGVFSGSSNDRLTVISSTLSGNSTDGSGGGISLYAGYIEGSGGTITGNLLGNYSGGASGQFFGNTITGSTISSNSAGGSGGGIAASVVTTVEDSTISGNTAGQSAGGIAGGYLTLSNSTISHNSARFDAGGVFSSRSTIIGSTISGNSAGGNGGGVSGFTAMINGSTISGNSAGLKGGGVRSSRLTINGSTISGNSAVIAAGVYIEGNATIRHSTIAFNTATSLGQGIVVPGQLTLDHTIVAQNLGPNGDIIGLLSATISARYSFIGDNYGSGLAPAFLGSPDANGNLIGTNSSRIDPLLGPLADYGGPTLTHVLLPASPAIDAGDSEAVAGVGNVPEFDQRGAPFERVRDGDAAEDVVIDIGAFEVQQFIPPPSLPGDYNLNSTVDAADYVVWRKTLGTSGVPAYSGADGDGDATIDQGDYGVWRSQFGSTLPLARDGSGDAATRKVPVEERRSSGATTALAEQVAHSQPTDMVVRASAAADIVPPLPTSHNSLRLVGLQQSRAATWDGARRADLMAWSGLLDGPTRKHDYDSGHPPLELSQDGEPTTWRDELDVAFESLDFERRGLATQTVPVD